MGTEVSVNTFAVSDVKDLEIRIAAADVRTKEAAGEEIRVEAKNLRDGRYTCEQNGGKLVVAHEIEGIGNFHRWNDETQIVLYLPEGMRLDSIVLEIGAGEVRMDAGSISCSDMDVEIGAGKWKAANLSVSGELNVKIGAGKAKMKRVTAGSVNIECGVGSSVYKGRIGGDIRVGCGVGSCSFQLENKEGDFNYDVSCAMGSVTINNNKIRSFASRKRYKSETALGTAVLECGLGSIEMPPEVIEIDLSNT
ncbi:MAG: DUF4097 domain-containing protein, partial [Lachnospiraceae bacterium]|nr:DUF4097 domain-containing protein [Lachnospiraceae bacterium]